jgi:hypothetical protein
MVHDFVNQLNDDATLWITRLFAATVVIDCGELRHSSGSLERTKVF